MFSARVIYRIQTPDAKSFKILRFRHRACTSSNLHERAFLYSSKSALSGISFQYLEGFPLFDCGYYIPIKGECKGASWNNTQFTPSYYTQYPLSSTTRQALTHTKENT